MSPGVVRPMDSIDCPLVPEWYASRAAIRDPPDLSGRTVVAKRDAAPDNTNKGTQ